MAIILEPNCSWQPSLDFGHFAVSEQSNGEKTASLVFHMFHTQLGHLMHQNLIINQGISQTLSTTTHFMLCSSVITIMSVLGSQITLVHIHRHTGRQTHSQLHRDTATQADTHRDSYSSDSRVFLEAESC